MSTCKAILAVVAALGAVDPAAAQSPPEAQGLAPEAPALRARDGRPARRGDTGAFVLADGRVVEGTLLSSTDHGSILLRDGGERLFLRGGELLSVVPVGGTAWTGLEDGEARAFLDDGRVVRGKVVERTSRRLVLETDRGPVALSGDEVREAWGTGGARLRLFGRGDVAAQRAIWAPTAFMPPAGEITISSTQLVQTSLEVGLPFGLAAGASTSVPVGFASDLGWNGSLGVRIGREVVSWLHLSAGAVTFASEQGNLVSVTGALTLGTRDRHLSLYGGPPPPTAEAFGAFGDRIFAASAGWRVTRRGALVAEGWLGPESHGSERLGAVAARFLGGRFSVDLGAAYTTAEGVFPFLGFDLTVAAP